MELKKSEKFLLLIANIVFVLYIAFVLIWIKDFKEYASKDYLSAKMVDQIRQQTQLTMDSANISSKDLSYVLEIMGQLAYVYLAVFLLLFILVILGQLKLSNHYIFGSILLVWSIFLTVFSLGILFITCLIYFFVGMKIIIERSSRIKGDRL
ncbi:MULTISPECIES: DUF4064 domain-containing protein [unclassified Gemella]|uniref:DUF4064 domain-containing protein n=1 Tax=unclassified Gemella TaxID=2624949 RepID=UPI0010737A73|nr:MULTISPECIES: DUF4064 domain-containing protein [unclassified Gemella]MBF0709842.1 DUF4064 domain-containing protein [Gemella sp. GL1.1]MBF0746853.1 DUF4064 domain-containing protein [Gemella sp. 19428wG2_WT2a]NYS27186.1 DUF4064 domain-containing protein [Gemella sp. GL1]TFU59576.1 DUF4064 domain-containing protein [Gemella sp. WT2a]